MLNGIHATFPRKMFFVGRNPFSKLYFVVKQLWPIVRATYESRTRFAGNWTRLILYRVANCYQN
jgi:hypothetical protein